MFKSYKLINVYDLNTLEAKTSPQFASIIGKTNNVLFDPEVGNIWRWGTVRITPVGVTQPDENGYVIVSTGTSLYVFMRLA